MCERERKGAGKIYIYIDEEIDIDRVSKQDGEDTDRIRQNERG